MQSFSSFINESAREMRFINPEHGSTVFTLKTGGKHSYLYNSNHKNPTRVFTNMSETEIVSELKSQGFRNV
jgi:hypothetical protein